MTGDWFTYVAISQLAASDAHPSASLVAVAASHTLPRWVLAPWAGSLADRVDRRTILVATQTARALIVAAMALLALRPSPSHLVAIHALHLARMCLGAFADAALRSALPALVGADNLRWAHARSGLAWSALLCAATALGGLTVAATGVAAAFAIDALSYAVSAALFARVQALPPTEPAASSPARTWRDLRDALRADRRFSTALFAKVPAALVQGALFVLVAERAQHAAARPAIALAAMHVARGLGAGAGPFVLRSRSADDPAARFGWIVLLAAGCFCFAPQRWLALPLLFALGLATGATWVHSSVAVASLGPASLRGRTAAAELALPAVTQWLGALVAGSPLGAPGALSLAALALIALSVHDRETRP
jgi:MFS family permease